MGNVLRSLFVLVSLLRRVRSLKRTIGKLLVLNVPLLLKGNVFLIVLARRCAMLKVLRIRRIVHFIISGELLLLIRQLVLVNVFIIVFVKVNVRRLLKSNNLHRMLLDTRTLVRS